MSELSEELYDCIIANSEKLRALLQREIELLSEIDRALTLFRLCPEFHTKGRKVGCVWHDVGGGTVFKGPWEFVVRSEGEERTFKQEEVPELLWNEEQRAWKRVRERRRTLHQRRLAERRNFG